MKKSVKIRLIIFEILLEIYKKNSNFEFSYNKITKNNDILEIKPRNEVIKQSQRIIFETGSVEGSINLKGGLLDIIVLI